MKGKRKIKNSFLILTSVIFLIACINYNVFAASQNGKEVNTSNNDILEISKSAQAVNNNRSSQLNDRSYKISLNARASSAALKNTNPSDIILVLDKSASMYYPAEGYSEIPIKCLKKSVKKFANEILKESPKSKISVITFSSGGPNCDAKGRVKSEIVPSGDPAMEGDLMEGYFIYKGNWEKISVRRCGNGYIGIIYDSKKYSGETFDVEWGGQNYYAEVDHGNADDAQVLTNFTSNLSTIKNDVNNIVAGGSTDTQSAFFKVKDQLNSIKNDNRSKYVILFTDGLPNVLVGDYNEGSDDVIQETINTYKEIENNNKDVDFISLGFKSRDSEGYARSEKFLKSVQNYNNQIKPGCNGLIYIENPDDIQGTYDEIANKVLNSATNDAIITDTVPDGFEIVNGSEEPKGAIIKNNTITWSKQEIGKENMTYTFKIKAKDTNFGTENLISEKNVTENPKLDITNSKDMNTNTNATISYTYNLDDSKHEQTFNVPHVSVPNDASLDLSSNKTYYYGDKIKLKDLIKYLNIKYGPEDGYTYIWSDNHGHSITLNNQKKNAKVGNTFDKNSKGDDSITLTEDTTFTLEIIKENKYDKDGTSKLDLKDSVNIKVINPKVTIIKKVDGEGDSNNVFSFKVTGNNNTWNLDVNENKPFTLTNLTKGTYTLSEIEAQGYKLESIKVNGKEISLNKPTFSISDDNYNIQIEIVNKKLNKSIYYNDTETIKNKF